VKEVESLERLQVGERLEVCEEVGGWRWRD